MKNITIVGGGSSGWLSSLFFNRKHPEYNITVIYSSKIDILGAGEGTTPNFSGFLYELGIKEMDFIKRCKATIKESNKFVNWSPNESEYVHDFDEGTISRIQKNLIHGFHFDARLAADFFKEIATERGVKFVDSKIVNFTTNDNDDITHIHTEDDITVETDFIIDCSGFARLIIGDFYKSNWKSYSEYLTINSALAFFLPQKDILTPTTKTHTKSIALNNGWMWQAPLQHRWGCGYAYNNNYVSFEDAKKEVEEYVGHEIDVVKTFKFNPGSYEKTWINNCVALGLSSGFLEPLEATSFLTFIVSIKTLNNIGIENVDRRDMYNEFVNNVNKQNLFFIRHHYNCNRIDTPFWVDNNNVEIPQPLKNIYDKGLSNIKNNDELLELMGIFDTGPVFGIRNYLIVDLGHKVKTEKTLV